MQNIKKYNAGHLENMYLKMYKLYIYKIQFFLSILGNPHESREASLRPIVHNWLSPAGICAHRHMRGGPSRWTCQTGWDPCLRLPHQADHTASSLAAVPLLPLNSSPQTSLVTLQLPPLVLFLPLLLHISPRPHPSAQQAAQKAAQRVTSRPLLTLAP